MRPMDDPEKVAQVAKDELLQSIDRNIEMQRKAFANESASVQATMEDTLLADIIAERDALARIDPADIEVDAPTGKMYKVALSPKPDDLLDYDLDIARMPKEMRAKIEAAARRAIEMSRDPEINNVSNYDPDQQSTVGALLGDSGSRFSDLPVAGLLSDLEDMVGTRLSTKLLNDEGIPGLKYRASGSRSPGIAEEAVQRNYVIFDDKAVKVLEKYGIVGPVLVTGGAVAATQRGGDEEGSIFPDA
jgi:hypothetical protein